MSADARAEAEVPKFGDTRLPDRFWEKAEMAKTGCWMWTAAKLPKGYGRFYFNGRNRPAHRVAYEVLIGSIPDGLEPDHLCRVTSCVNPAHIEPVTQRENILRSTSFAAANAAKTHCPKGHPYTGSYLDGGSITRTCLTCRAESARAYRERRKGNDTRKPCSIGGCNRPSEARGLCGSHYQKWRREAAREVRS